MLSAMADLRLADVELLVQAEGSQRPLLAELLSRLAAALPALSDALTQTYLSHLQTSRHLSVTC